MASCHSSRYHRVCYSNLVTAWNLLKTTLTMRSLTSKEEAIQKDKQKNSLKSTYSRLLQSRGFALQVECYLIE